jgi:hypothetical protein
VAVCGRLRPGGGPASGGDRAAVGLAGALAVAAVVATLFATAAALPAGRVFGLTFAGLLGGSALAAAAGRSFRAGVRAAAWAVLLAAPLVTAGWLVEAVAWHQRGLGLLLDGEGGRGVGANLADAVWWPLIFLTLWALPIGVLGAAAGRSARAVRQRFKQGKHP